MHKFRKAWLGIVWCALWLGCSGKAETVDGAQKPTGPTVVPSATSAASTGGTAAPAHADNTAGSNTASGPVTPTTAPAGMAGAAATAAGAAAPASGITYHRDIRPIVAANCSAACHGPDPATRTGPVALDSYANVKMIGALVVNAVTTKRMPPWPPEPGCHELRDTPPITDAQRGLFKQWQTAGFPEGSEADYVAPQADRNADLGAPTRIITMEAAITPPPNADQYACGRGDYTFTKDTYVRAIEVLPDQKPEVHHVQIHVVTSSACTTGDNIYSWRPGGRRLVFSDGDAALLKAGSSFNFQMHYNTIGKTPTPDKTQVALWELPDGQKPQREVTRVAVFAIPPLLTPGAVQSSTGTQSLSGSGVEIIGVSPHAHMIAKTMTANLKRANGKTECLTNIQDWKFEWQMDYLFKEPLPVMAGDTVEATCGYDNSVEHQPTVDGVKRAQPITVGPGEGTADEMCLHYVWLRRPTP